MEEPTAHTMIHCTRCGRDWPESAFDPDGYKEGSSPLNRGEVHV